MRVIMSTELSRLADWLGESGELFIQIVAPRDGAQPGRPIRSLSELDGAIAQVRVPGTSILIWKDAAQARRHPHPPAYDWVKEHSGEVMLLTSYVRYADLLTPSHLATISSWLAERGEVFVQIELPHTRGNGYYHVVSSLTALQRALGAVRHPEVEIFIWKSPERGVPLDLVRSRPDEVLYFAVRGRNRAG